ncbi:hypothetical protein [uncultured Roseobacter sp.]|uniref:hypothetical protein n=1 Tax=uncultured Roseobacter sp. TaxID=114847 RepID=UPI00260E076D|nr:hypothetical protein [uncultured Roseobacter sp.]
MNNAESGNGLTNSDGSGGLGTDPAFEAALDEAIAIMFGMRLFEDMQEIQKEDREMFPEEGTT